MVSEDKISLSTFVYLYSKPKWGDHFLLVFEMEPGRYVSAKDSKTSHSFWDSKIMWIIVEKCVSLGVFKTVIKIVFHLWGIHQCQKGLVMFSHSGCLHILYIIWLWAARILENSNPINVHGEFSFQWCHSKTTQT